MIANDIELQCTQEREEARETIAVKALDLVR